jgi:hypothetical protein
VPPLNLFKEQIAVRFYHHKKHTNIYVERKIESFLMLVCALQRVAAAV